METLSGFDTTITLCFTPPSRGKTPHCTSPPLVTGEFAEFAEAVIRRYAPFNGNGRQAEERGAALAGG
jgi:hypothetical protein